MEVRQVGREVRGHAREVMRLSPGRPALGLGLRAAIATFVPLGLSAHFHAPELRWSLVAGFMVAIVDKGGAYKTRALAMAWLTLGGALAVLLVSLVPDNAVAAACAMFVVAALASLGRVYGPEAASAGTSAIILCAIAVDAPSGRLDDALMRAGLVAAGGAWAMTLSLVLWPVRVYRPARLAIAACFRGLADHAAAMSRLLDEAGGDAWQTDVVLARGRVRDAIEAARGVLAATRRGDRGESGRAARLLVLFHVADQIFALTGALNEVLETAHASPAPDGVRDLVRGDLDALAEALAQTAARIESEEPLERLALRATHEDALRAAGPDYAHAAALFSQAAAFTDTAAEITATLHDDRAPPSVPGLPTTLDVAPSGSRLDPLREALAPGSVVSRHALRVALVVAVAVALTRALHLDRGYWVTITAVAILQPHGPETFVKALQRIAGTVAGSALAAVVAATVHDPRGIMLLTVVLCAVSVSVVQINYALFSFFLTPTFVLLAELSGGDWSLAERRVVNTLIGGALALVGARALWPTRESDRFPRQMAAAVRALAALVEATATREPDIEARRAAGVAFNNAEASFNRLLAESHGDLPGVEPRMTLLLYVRRATGTLLALAATEPLARRAELAGLAKQAAATLEGIASALEGERAPEPEAPLDLASVADATLRARVERIAAQLSVLHQAATNLARANAPSVKPARAAVA